MSSNKQDVVNQVLGVLDSTATTIVNQNKQLVWQFVEKLSRCLQQETGVLKGAHVSHSGSAYENLAVQRNADFDLLLQLGEPFVSSNFKITQITSPRFMYHKLRCSKALVKQGRKKVFCSKRKNLNTSLLRNAVFDRLQEILQTITLPGTKVDSFPKLAALQVNLTATRGQELVQMDLTPQIVGRAWEECPGLVPKWTLPPCLQDYIMNNEENGSPILFFTPAVPKAAKLMQYQISCMMGFSMLEKHFLRQEDGIHDMVRLAKLVKDRQNWTANYGLKSFHLKRLAIKKAGILRGKTIWDGFKTLMQCLENDLASGGMKDCFVEDQIIYTEKPNKLQRFRQQLQDLQKWDVGQLKVILYKK